MLLLCDVGRGQGVEGGGLLVLVGGVQHWAFGKIVADDLQADGQTIGQATGDGHTGQARQVSGDGVDVFQIHSHRVFAFGAEAEGGAWGKWGRG